MLLPRSSVKSIGFGTLTTDSAEAFSKWPLDTDYPKIEETFEKSKTGQKVEKNDFRFFRKSSPRRKKCDSFNL